MEVVEEEELICSQCGGTYIRMIFDDGEDGFISNIHTDTWDSCADVWDREHGVEND